MKKTVWIPPLVLFCGLTGVAAWLLRWRLLSTGADHKGLLAAGHPLGILSWVLTALVAAVVAAVLWKHRKAAFVLPAASGSEAARIAAMVMAAIALWGNTRLETVAAVAAAVTAVAALVRLLLRKKQLSPALGDIPALVFYLLCLLALYRGWSGEPEVQRYAFSLLALVCLMFATYFRSAVALGMGKSPLYLGCGFLGAYLAFAAAADPGFGGMFLLLGLWQLWAIAEEA